MDYFNCCSRLTCANFEKKTSFLNNQQTSQISYKITKHAKDQGLKRGTVVPTKSDSDVIFCLQLLSKI